MSQRCSRPLEAALSLDLRAPKPHAPPTALLEQEREQLAELGYSAYAIARLAADTQYGPRAGLSDAARLLRAHTLGMLPARDELPLAQSVLLEEEEWAYEDDEAVGDGTEAVDDLDAELAELEEGV